MNETKLESNWKSNPCDICIQFGLISKYQLAFSFIIPVGMGQSTNFILIPSRFIVIVIHLIAVTMASFSIVSIFIFEFRYILKIL